MKFVYEEVPRDLKGNLLYRKAILDIAAEQPAVIPHLLEAAAKDFLFFVNSFCVAAGTMVMTDRGLVPIESVTSRDLVWDGDEWVQQGGALCQGRKSVIFAYGIRLTSDHKVWTKHGWQDAGDGHDRAEVRLPGGYQEKWNLPKYEAGRVALPMRVREYDGCLREQSQARADEQLRPFGWREGSSRKDAEFDLQHLDGHEGSVQQSKVSLLLPLRRPWNFSLRAVDGVRELLERHGREAEWSYDRKDQQRWQLRTRQLSLGDHEGAIEQHKEERQDPHVAGGVYARADCTKGRSFFGWNQGSHGGGNFRGRIADSEIQDSAVVYDLINCGPRRAFTVIDNRGRPLIVHNCWLFEPRPEQSDSGEVISKIVPFISWPHQNRAYYDMKPLWGFEDIGIIKSRGEGASWLILMMMLHGWMFSEMEAYGLVSRNEVMVDNPRNPNSLMWKLDWAISTLPKWMIDKPDYTRVLADHALVHNKTKSTIVGESATGNVARGGRATVFLMDEFAAFKEPDGTKALDSTRDVTNCRIMLSTPQGPFGAYYETLRSQQSLKKIGLWWHQNPTKNKGLYKVVNHELVLVDVKYWADRAGLSEEEAKAITFRCRHQDENNSFQYGFWLQGEYVLDGKLRSPWYDKQCARATSPRSIAQELDGDFGGAMTRFFDAKKMDELADKCLPPIFKGDILFDLDEPHANVRLVDGSTERFSVWSSFLLGARVPLREHDYTLGIDIAGGSGSETSSNSVISVCDRNTRQICAEYVTNSVEPSYLADLAVAMGHFYRGPKGLALLIPERNGMGGVQFMSRLKDLRYANIYEQKTEDRRSRKTTKRLGLLTQRPSKAALLGEFSRALNSGELICQSRACLEEAKQYMLMANGAIEHVAAAHSKDPSESGENHGDRVIGAACAWKAATEYGASVQVRKKVKPTNLMTMAGRLAALERKDRGDKSNLW